MGEDARQITPVPLTRDAWAPFGWLPVADTDPRDGDQRLDYAWQDVHVNLIGHRRDEVPDSGRRPAAARSSSAMPPTPRW